MNKKPVFKIIVEDRYGTVTDEYNFEEGEFIIGRSRQCDIILPSDNVSRRHAKFFTYEGICFIEDLNSSNGVFVNGKRVKERAELNNENVIKIGDYYLHFYSPEGKGKENRVFLRLVGLNLITAEKVFIVNQPVCLVGRGKDCHISIVDPSISRLHAKISLEEGGIIKVEDMNSSNKTFINNIEIKEGALKGGDKIRFGNVEFLAEIPTADTSETGFEEGWKERNILLFPFYYIIDHIKVFLLFLVLILIILLLTLYLPPLLKTKTPVVKLNDIFQSDNFENALSNLNEEVAIKILLIESLNAIIDNEYFTAEGKLKEILWKNPTNSSAQKLFNFLQFSLEAKKKIENANDAITRGNFENALTYLSSIPKNIINKMDVEKEWRKYYEEILNKLLTNCKIPWSKKCTDILVVLERLKNY